MLHQKICNFCKAQNDYFDLKLKVDKNFEKKINQILSDWINKPEIFQKIQSILEIDSYLN